MNTPIFETELDPAEQKRRAAEQKRQAEARRKDERALVRLGFRRLAAQPGFWYHEEVGAGRAFNLGQISSIPEMIGCIYEFGLIHGRAEVRNAFKRELGL